MALEKQVSDCYFFRPLLPGQGIGYREKKQDTDSIEKGSRNSTN